MDNSRFNLTAISLAIATAFCLGSLQAHAVEFGNEEGVDQNAYETSFKAMDTDNDGTLDANEVRNDPLFKNKIKAADKDNDNTLDQAEYTEYRSQHEKKVAKRVISDSTITAKIKAKLLKEEGLKGMKVSVETNHGDVLLSGFVDSADQIKQAENIAKSTEGVKSVKNSLVVKKAD